MTRRRVLVILAGAAALWGAGPMAVPGAAGAWPVSAAREAVPAASSWSRAIGVPGLAALNKGGDAAVNQVSVARRAAARPVGFTRTAMVMTRDSWPARRTAPGARRSRCPAWRR
jgi:hypothetical protein